MTKPLIIIGLLLAVLSGSASAQTCGVIPNNLTNGTNADATQVMGNFNYIANCLNSLRGYLGGLTLSNDATSPNTVVDTTAGAVASDDPLNSNLALMTIAAVTKNANAAWASGSGNGCLDTGSALTATTWYHLFVIANPATGAVDELCTASTAVPPSPTMPTGFTKKRRVGSFKTDSSSRILAFSQNGDEFLWVTPLLDLYTTALGPTPSSYALNVPSGFKVNALISGYFFHSTAIAIGQLYSPDQLGNVTTVINDVAGTGAAYIVNIRTNAMQQIRAVSSNTNSVLSISTYGWIDTRGRFN